MDIEFYDTRICKRKNTSEEEYLSNSMWHDGYLPSKIYDWLGLYKAISEFGGKLDPKIVCSGRGGTVYEVVSNLFKDNAKLKEEVESLKEEIFSYKEKLSKIKEICG